MNSRDYQPGEQVPGTVYRIVGLIGAGGMGTVYEVEDETIGKRYVLKTLHPQLGAREDLARRMQSEARTLARLNHPNIVEVITAGVTADDLRLPYYVMQKLNGQSLRLVLEKKGQLELTHAYHITIDLLDALDHAHDKGVIHRDVKPDNIFLHRTSAGVTLTKLLDFGIVSILDSGGGETAGRFVGTLRYAAPEQLRGEKATPKTDVYAAGLVLYEIIAGRGPFDDVGDPQSIGTAHLKKLPPPVSLFADAIPRELDILLSAALAKDPTGRPRDAFSFAASLRNLKRNQHAPYFSEGVDVMSAGPPSGPSRELASGTDRGVVPPSVGQGVVVPIAARTASRALEAIDRATPRRIAIDMRRVPQQGAETLSIAPSYPAPPTAGIEGSPSQDEWGGPPSHVRWGGERGPERSEAPQVRSLHAPVVGRASAAAWISGVLGTCALVGAAAGVWVVGRTPSTSEFGNRVGAAGFREPPSAAPILTAPAPTLDLPAFEEPRASDARAKAVPSAGALDASPQP